MNTKVLWMLCAGLIAGNPALAGADEVSHRQAVQELFEIMNLEDSTSRMVIDIVDIQLKQTPALQPAREDLLAFYNRCMNWASLKDEMTKLYLEAFTEQELRDMTAFYRTPTGRKSLAMQPELFRKGAEIGQRKVQERMPELIQLLQKYQPARPRPAAPSRGSQTPAE